MCRLLSGEKRSRELDIGPVERILGFDEPVGYLHAGEHACDFAGGRSVGTWDDVSVSGSGTAYAFRRRCFSPGAEIQLLLMGFTGHHSLFVFPSLDSLLVGESSITPKHPAFNASHPARVYSMESRSFLHSLGPMHQLFEIVNERRGKACEPELVLIEDLEGTAFACVPGSCNRLGILTEMGSAYVLEKRSQEIEPLEIPGEVRLLGLGSNFEIAIVDGEVLLRGSGEYDRCSSG